jgi:hypothetical protein
MKHRSKLVVALGLASLLAISATWAFATGDSSPKAKEASVTTHATILLFTAIGIPNVGDRCTDFLGASFDCEPTSADFSTSLPRAGNLKSLIINPTYNGLKTDLVVALYLNNVPTALFTVIPAGSTRTRIVHTGIQFEAGDSIKIVTQGFTSEHAAAERLLYTGSVVYEHP